MFILKKLVTYIILPPGVFILVFIGSGLYLVNDIGEQKSEVSLRPIGAYAPVGGQPSTQSYAVPRMSEGQEQGTAVYAKLRRAKEDGKVRGKGY